MNHTAIQRATIRGAIHLALIAMYRPGDRVIPAARLADALGISRFAAWCHLHAAAQEAGVQLWHSREFHALVVERMP